MKAIDLIASIQRDPAHYEGTTWQGIFYLSSGWARRTVSIRNGKFFTVRSHEQCAVCLDADLEQITCWKQVTCVQAIEALKNKRAIKLIQNPETPEIEKIFDMTTSNIKLTDWFVSFDTIISGKWFIKEV